MYNSVAAVIDHLQGNPNLIGFLANGTMDEDIQDAKNRIRQDVTSEISRQVHGVRYEHNFDDLRSPIRRTVTYDIESERDAASSSLLDNTPDPLIIVQGNGGLRFDPVFFPRIETICFPGKHDAGGNILPRDRVIQEAWRFDNIVTIVMEKTGVIRFCGQSYGTPACESDGIPGRDSETERVYIYRSYLLTHVGPTAFSL